MDDWLPNVKTVFQMVIKNEQILNDQLAETVKNGNNANFVLHDGDAYRNLLIEARMTLQLLCDQAKEDLLNGAFYTQFVLVVVLDKIMIRYKCTEPTRPFAFFFT